MRGGRAMGGHDCELWGHRYVSSSVTENGRPRFLVRGTRITLWFVDETQRLSAHAGGNTVMFEVDVDDGVLKTRSPFSTVLSYPREVTNQDTWLTEFLLLAPAWTAIDGTLILTDDRTRIELEQTADRP
ncbi:META domain-containing protein [Nocardia sp. NPDC004278]|uniref:META domain-containing protein n=1 Tax=Nocardia sp. NPDC004604 TaxID=3157013 RepID=UPI0033A661DB